MSAAAVLTGARSFTAIADWATDTGRQQLQALGIGDVVPSESTIRGTLESVDSDRFDAIVNSWMRLQFTTIGGRQVVAAPRSAASAPIRTTVQPSATSSSRQCARGQ